MTAARTVTVTCDGAETDTPTPCDRVTAESSTAARSVASNRGWQVGIRREVRTSQYSTSFVICDYCPAHRVHAPDGFIRLEQSAPPSLPHVQRAVLAALCANPASKWSRLKDITDTAHGAIAALVVKGWAESRDVKYGAKVRTMHEYRATKAGRAALEAAS